MHFNGFNAVISGQVDSVDKAKTAKLQFFCTMPLLLKVAAAETASGSCGLPGAQN
jgi:hypothetical protein